MKRKLIEIQKWIYVKEWGNKLFHDTTEILMVLVVAAQLNLFCLIQVFMLKKIKTS